MGLFDGVASFADRIGDGLKAGYGSLYESFDNWAYGYLPGGTTRSEASETWETGWRDLADATGIDPQSRAVDFPVGATRIITGTVGEGTNPTWSDAWRTTDQTIFRGWAPGGDEPDGIEDAKEALKWGVAALAALAVLAVRR